MLSRVLTVAGPDGRGHKLLIPFLDLFNHARSSAHVLTGRSDGLLKVVARTLTLTRTLTLASTLALTLALTLTRGAALQFEDVRPLVEGR